MEKAFDTDHSKMMWDLANGITIDKQLSKEEMQKAYKLIETSLTQHLTAYIMYNVGEEKIITYSTILDKLSKGYGHPLSDNEMQVVKAYL